MDDLYSSLIGGAPSTAEQQKAIVDQLRRRRSFGELGALTGDRVLQPFGQSLMKDADQYASDIQGTRQKDIDNAQTQQYQTGQLGHMASALAETTRNNDLEHQDRQDQIAAMLEAAGIRARAKAGVPKKMTDNTRNSILATVDAYSGIDNLMKTFKPEYTQKLGAGPQSQLVNSLARYGIGSSGAKEAQDWWAAWNEIRTLPERNRLFGATLTPNEKSEWEKVDINPSMGQDQISKAATRIQKILQRHAQNRARGMVSEGYDPEMIGEYYQDLLPGMDSDQSDATHGTIDRGGGGGKRIRVDAEGNVIGN